MALSAKARLKKKKDIDSVFQKGKPRKALRLSIFFLPNNLTHNRWALSVSVKTARTVSARNRIRRILLGEIQTLPTKLMHGYDLVVVVKNLGSEEEMRYDLKNTYTKLQHET